MERPKVQLKPRVYTPVVDQNVDKLSIVSRVKYISTTGVIMRRALEPTRLGVSVATPEETFNLLFPEFMITNYLGQELFSSNDFEKETPNRGLIIEAQPKAYCVRGPFIETDGRGFLESYRRQQPINPNQVKRMIENVESWGLGISARGLANCCSNYKQKVHDKKHLVELLKPFVEI